MATTTVTASKHQQYQQQNNLSGQFNQPLVYGGENSQQQNINNSPQMVGMIQNQQFAIGQQQMMTGQRAAIVQTPNGPAQIVIPSNMVANNQQHQQQLLQQQLLISQIQQQQQLNQHVEVVMADGSRVQGNLAQLQAQGVIPQSMMNQYLRQQQQALLNSVPAAQTQFMTNAAGQVFALSATQMPQLVGFQQPTQVVINPVTGQQVIQLTQSNPQPQVIPLVQPIIVPQPQQQQLSSSDATRLHVQNIIQQQKAQIYQQHNPSSGPAKVQIPRNLKSAISRTLKPYTNTLVTSTTLTPRITSQPVQSAVISPMVSSHPSILTSSHQTEINCKEEDDDEEDKLIIGDIEERITTESCSASPSLSVSPARSLMEPESTTTGGTQSTIANAINNNDTTVVDGVNLEEIKKFALQFKFTRQKLGLTQTQVGMALSASQGPSYSQSAICRFEKLEITPKSALKIKPVLEQWMQDAELKYQNGEMSINEIVGPDSNKKRKRRTSFNPIALAVLNQFFNEKSTHPDSSQMTALAEQLDYGREVIRVWFCNKRQSLKNSNNNNSNDGSGNNFKPISNDVVTSMNFSHLQSQLQQQQQIINDGVSAAVQAFQPLNQANSPAAFAIALHCPTSN